MDKLKQKQLMQWLKKQSLFAKSWLIMAISFAFISGLLLVGQAFVLAHLLHELIIEQTEVSQLSSSFIGLALIVLLRAGLSYAKEQAGYRAGETVRLHMRQLVLDKLTLLGPAYIQGKPAGTWASLVLEQIELMHDFFARYLPQMAIAVLVPFIILFAVFPFNWAAGLIFLLTAPLVPFFMALVGMGAADANRRNVKALQRLSGHFYDRLKGLSSLRLFDHIDAETKHLELVSHDLRKRTMEVLRLAFLSSAVLEFFTSLSIALTAVYFGFSFLGELNFGHYGLEITLFVGAFILILAPEFYQPLRDLGTFYHAKAQAIGAAQSLVDFLETMPDTDNASSQVIKTSQLIDLKDKSVHIHANQLEVYTFDGHLLVGPLNFEINQGDKIALVGESGAGKTSLINALLGFLPYKGSLKINGIELNTLPLADWQAQISWVGQNPQLFHGTIKDNICLARPDVTPETLMQIATKAHAEEFIIQLDKQFDYLIGDQMQGLSVGQAQRIALARALLQEGQFWILDEPTASLDANSERLVLASLKTALLNKTALLITHRLDELQECDAIWVMAKGKFIAEGRYLELSQKGYFSELLKTANTTKRNRIDA